MGKVFCKDCKYMVVHILFDPINRCNSPKRGITDYVTNYPPSCASLNPKGECSLYEPKDPEPTWKCRLFGHRMVGSEGLRGGVSYRGVAGPSVCRWCGLRRSGVDWPRPDPPPPIVPKPPAPEPGRIA